ncbi:MAG TPA: DsbA family protein [Candidatus Limnocylindrales bacterium]|nr:DsbA family protein [Candidatus Limnocylindrales bacterium]
MRNIKFILLVIILSGFVVLGLAGSEDKKDLEELKANQQAILQRLEKLEKGQEEITSLQKEILAKLDHIIREEASVFPPLRKALEAREANEVDYSKVYTIPLGNSPVKGPDSASITIVEFSDFQCPFCNRATHVVDQVLKTYPDKIKFVYKQFPIPSLHEHAINASKASLAAHKQGKFWEMHDLLFKNSPELQEEKLMEYAQSLNLDMEQFKKDYASPEIEEELQEDMKLGEEVEIRGTPTFFVNGKRLPSWSFDTFQKAIEGELDKK